MLQVDVVAMTGKSVNGGKWVEVMGFSRSHLRLSTQLLQRRRWGDMYNRVTDMSTGRCLNVLGQRQCHVHRCFINAIKMVSGKMVQWKATGFAATPQACPSECGCMMSSSEKTCSIVAEWDCVPDMSPPDAERACDLSTVTAVCYLTAPRDAPGESALVMWNGQGCVGVLLMGKVDPATPNDSHYALIPCWW